MMKNKKIILAGGTGFIGQYLCNYFGKDNQIVILTRNSSSTHNNALGNHELKSEAKPNIKYVNWDARTVGEWVKELDAADLVINLAGRSVNCRYTFRNMKEIFDSRVNATKVLGQGIKRLSNPPKVWINAASATIYRHATDRSQDEYKGEISELKSMNMPSTSAQDFYSCLHVITKWGLPSLFIPKKQKLRRDFSVRVCRLWEKTFNELETPKSRKLCLRIAIALGPGGAMIPFLNLLKFGLGGYQGNGRQKYSWVHIKDLCRVIEWIEGHPEMEGTYNCASPEPVTNKKFMKTLRNVTGHILGLPAFKWMLEIGTSLIGTESELILKSRWVVPSRLTQAGFHFRFERLEDALQDIIKEMPRKKYHLF